MLPVLIFLPVWSVRGQEEDDFVPARRFRWRHNEPKEDPIQRRNFVAEVDGTCNEKLEFMNPMSGQIATPKFERNYYPNDTDCTWEITTSEGLAQG